MSSGGFSIFCKGGVLDAHVIANQSADWCGNLHRRFYSHCEDGLAVRGNPHHQFACHCEGACARGNPLSRLSLFENIQEDIVSVNIPQLCNIALPLPPVADIQHLAVPDAAVNGDGLGVVLAEGRIVGIGFLQVSA